jgi:hypothetical protein
MSQRARVSELLAKWEAFARELHQGYRFGLDDWLNDVDVRRLIAEAGDLLPSHQRRLAAADARVREATQPHDKCLWGTKNAQQHGWKPTTHWYYFARPACHGEPFGKDLARVQ